MPPQRRALGFLFSVLTIGFVLVAVAAADARQWVIALAAAVLAFWLGGLAVRGLRPR